MVDRGFTRPSYARKLEIYPIPTQTGASRTAQQLNRTQHGNNLCIRGSMDRDQPPDPGGNCLDSHGPRDKSGIADRRSFARCRGLSDGRFQWLAYEGACRRKCRARKWDRSAAGHLHMPSVEADLDQWITGGPTRIKEEIRRWTPKEKSGAFSKARLARALAAWPQRERWSI